MLTVGLTGGIGSGKSTVAARFSEHGALLIDADAVAREVVLPGNPAFAAILARFGTVDRAALARVVFSDAGALRDLNAIVHPAVSADVDSRLTELAASDPDGVVILEVPLLVEAGWQKGDLVVVVDCPEEVAIRRLVSTRGMSEADARRRVSAQASRAERLARADRVIVNDGTEDDLRREVDTLWAELVQTRTGDT